MVDLTWYYRVICLENMETPDWAHMIHRYLSKLVLDLTHLWLNICYQTCVSFLLKLLKCFRDFDQVLLNLLLVNPLSREGNGNSLQYSCLENPMGRGAWWAAIHGITKSRTGLNEFTFTFHFHALEKEMAAHSSVLAWRIPGTVEPGGLASQSWTWLKWLNCNSNPLRFSL